MNERFDWYGVYHALYSLAPRVLRNFPDVISQDVEDIIQETMLKLFSAVESGKLTYDEWPSRGLLIVMIKRQAIDRIRARRRIAFLGKLNVHEPASDKRSEDEWKATLWQHLKSGLDRLSPEDRLLLLKFYRGKVKIQQLADETGVSYSAMAVRLHRIKKKLRDELERLID